MKLREIFEALANLVVAFRRMNPHYWSAKLVDKIKSMPGDRLLF